MARWAGPPPLLIAATVLGVLIAPAVSQAEEPPVARTSQASPLGEQTGASPLVPSTGRESPADAPSEVPTEAPGEAPAEKKKAAVKIAPQRIGVATFNEYRPLTVAQARQDALAITGRDGVSIVGWQEGYLNGPVYSLLQKQGWATKRVATSKSASELAVSWRRSRFSLVSSSLEKLVPGLGSGEGRYPFGDRYALRVTLKERATGELLTVINTHLPQAVEDLDRPGHWRATKNAARAHRQLDRLTRVWAKAPGRWVIGTGDYNVDARADRQVRPAGGVSRTYAGTARSSYDLLGFEGLQPTHPYSGRYIDYVHVAQPDLARGRVVVRGQRTLSGLNSDHRPLLVWLTLK